MRREGARCEEEEGLRRMQLRRAGCRGRCPLPGPWGYEQRLWKRVSLHRPKRGFVPSALSLKRGLPPGISASLIYSPALLHDKTSSQGCCLT